MVLPPQGLPVVRGPHWDKVVDGESDGGRGTLGFAVSQDNGAAAETVVKSCRATVGFKHSTP